jgi:DNA ligase (NAD+)
MYTAEQTLELQKATAALLQQNSIELQQIDTLRNTLRFHEYRYYVINDPLLSDTEYDQLFKQLQQLEKVHPEAVRPDSPTQRVGSSLNGDFVTVQHLVPMLSLENSYNADDLLDWDRKAKEASGLSELVYCVEPKFDGASISLIYENDLLTRGATRGDGVEGDDITTNIKQIKNIPLGAAFSDYGIQQIEIRGEVLMSKNSFAAYNQGLAEQNLPPLANPRNAASGSLRIKDPKEVGRRKLEAFLYNVSYSSLLPNAKDHALLHHHSGMLQMLWNCGFRSPQNEKKVLHGIQAVIDYVHDFEQHRDDLPYEIDGMVIKVDDLALQDKMGMTSHHPRWAIAYKFKARQAKTQLLSVEYQVGRTGAITPVAKTTPVAIGGVMVSSISLHNEEFIKERDIKIGDMVLVERAGDVIPYIVKSELADRKGTETTIVFPTHCPVCASTLVKPESESVWRCANLNCEAQVVERMIHFVSKDAMDIRSFGEANVRKFYEQGLLKNIPGIYQLDFASIASMDGFGKKSIEKLQQNIEASKTQPLHRLIYALGIRFVGETTAKTLANAVANLLDLQNKSLEDLQSLEDVGVKVASSVQEYFSNADNITLLQELQALGLPFTNTKKDKVIVDGNLTGQTFLFTGTLNQLKRSDAEAMVEANGGKLLSGVSSKLNYLVVGEDAGSKLEKAKKITTIKVITEQEFLNLVGN